jgi:hypothetical protein
MRLSNKRPGFALLEVMFAVFLVGFSLATFFIYLNHLFQTTSKTVDASSIIEASPIMFSDLVQFGSKKDDSQESNVFRDYDIIEQNKGRKSDYCNVANLRVVTNLKKGGRRDPEQLLYCHFKANEKKN